MRSRFMNMAERKKMGSSNGPEVYLSSGSFDARHNGSTEDVGLSHDSNLENNVSENTDMFEKESSVGRVEAEKRLVPEESKKLAQDAPISSHDSEIEGSKKKPSSPKAYSIGSLEKENGPTVAGFSATDFKDSAGNKSCELQREPSRFCKEEEGELSVVGQLSTDLSKNIDKLEIGSGMERRIPSEDTVVNEKFEASTSLVGASDMKKVQMQTQPELETESEDSAAIEDDVKVCDTCGDAGLEDKLAFCSRCNDGAEHIYCMWMQLEELPEGDWFCEECKLKDETENQEVNNFKMVSKTFEIPGSDENNKIIGNAVNSNLVSKLETKPMNEEEKTLHEVHKKHAGDDEVVGCKKAWGYSNGTIGTSEEAVPSHGTSLGSLDKRNFKSSKSAPFAGVTSANNSQAVAFPQISLGSSSLNVQAGHILKSVSFNNSSMKARKVVQLTGVLPRTQKLSRDSAPNTRKGEVERSMAKAASFKGISSTNVDPISKLQPVPWKSNMRDVKLVRERNLTEKKSSSTVDRPLLSPKPVNDTGTSLPKPDLKSMPPFELNILGSRTDDANKFDCNKVNQQSSRISKSFRSSSSNVICNSEDKKQCQAVSNDDMFANFAPDIYCSNFDTVSSSAPHVLDHIDRNEKSKDLSFSNCSKQTVSSSCRILRCQRCNEGGHATQNCPIDRLRMTALKLSSERNLKDRTDNSNKWKDAAKIAISRTTAQKNNNFSNQNEKLSVPGAKFSCLVSSRESQSRNLLSAERASDAREYSVSIADVNNIDGKPEQHTGAMSASSTSELYSLPTLVDELTVKPSLQPLPDQASFLTNLTRATVLPELEFIWQGGFEVLRTGRLPELCEGLQAHLSTCVSPKVFEFANKFPCRVKVDEVPRQCFWPLQFQEDCPKDNNIALFFFAKDTESYEKTYRNLLENMLLNDLALKADVDGVELLIYPSNKLPENSQRWNGLLFLWGVFRGRKENFSGKVPHSEKIDDCTVNVETFPGPLISENFSGKAPHSEKIDDCTVNVETFPGPLISECSTSVKIESCEIQYKELSLCEMSLREAEDAACMDFQSVPSSGIKDVKDTNCHSQESQPLQSTQAAIDKELLSKDNSCPSLKGHGIDSEDGRYVAIYHASTSNCEQGTGDGANSNQEQLKPVEGKGVLNNDILDAMMMVDRKNWESRLHRKRGHSDSASTIPSFSDETSKSTGETTECIEKANCTSSVSVKEHKKMKLDIGRYGSCTSKEQSSNVKVPLLSASLLDTNCSEASLSESSSVERNFFSVDVDLVKDAKPDTSIYILSSDDDDMPEPNAPNLDLALGGNKKTSSQESLPSYSSLSFKMIRESKQPGLAIDDRGDGSASLSLSLAFPPSE